MRSPFRAMLAALRGRAGPTAEAQLPPPRPPPDVVNEAGGGCGGVHDGFDGIIIDDRDDDGRRWEDGGLPRPEGGVFITWEDVWVTAVDGRGQTATILHGISGSARPGEVLAIMGPSGCGKTTLLDALAGNFYFLSLHVPRVSSGFTSVSIDIFRATGQEPEEQRDILINGRRQKLAFGTSIDSVIPNDERTQAYVTQENVLMATLTVRETIYYSAQIQLPDTMPVAEKLSWADDTIQEMGLTSAMDTRVGGRETKGISGGQRKRLSICLEILTRPRLLFLDEPTSGLDSAASFHVMSRIAGLAAREGMTVVAVVQQPCTEVFELFHGLCLLASGRTIYFGLAANATEESGERTVSKPSAADEAIETLVNAYSSSSTSENAKKQMDDINEMSRSSMLMFTGGLLTLMAIGGFPSFVEEMKVRPLCLISL
ncbi:hypothetical protein HU200_041190 [Digitaria exilis]|uniref:ABC transporter domain-containing protein n=1 Tax=Digitaria exilis TaxID=1010633 RepID=A0A835EH76_9POAL|nr:hypothetical protein HU200_041190 [Digitaria exilis]